MPRILCYGSLNLDYVYQVPHFLQPGETLASTRRDVVCGGKGLNQAIAAARAGAQVFQAGKTGAEGQILRDTLVDSGVDVTLLAKSDGPGGHTFIQVDPSGQNCILLYGGSNQDIRQDEVDKVLDWFRPGDWLMLQNEINQLDYIMEGAAKRGLSIVLNPSPIDDKLMQLPLELVGLFVFNEIEGAALSGTQNEEEMLDLLRKKWPRSRLLLTLGSRGCIYDDGQRRLRHGIYQAHAVDTTAAGDTFTGYFVAAMASGQPVERALDLASKAAAIAVTRPGAAPSIPTMDEVLASSLTLA